MPAVTACRQMGQVVRRLSFMCDERCRGRYALPQPVPLGHAFRMDAIFDHDLGEVIHGATLDKPQPQVVVFGMLEACAVPPTFSTASFLIMTAGCAKVHPLSMPLVASWRPTG